VRSNHCRRGVTLALVVMMVALVGGLISLLAWHSGHLHQARQRERARLVADQVARSTASYAQIHARELAASPSTQPVELNASDLVPAPFWGKASIEVRSSGESKVAHVVARVENSIYSAEQEIDVPLPPASMPANNSQPATKP